MDPIDLPSAVLGFVGVHMALRTESDDLVRTVTDGIDLARARRVRTCSVGCWRSTTTPRTPCCGRP